MTAIRPDAPAAPPSTKPPREDAPRAFTVRGVGLGFAVVAIVCALAPWNDYVVGNTSVVGCFLPLGVTLLVFALVIAVNAPLRRWWTSRSLGAGELAVVVAMGLVGSAIPASGLMRYLPAGIVGLEHAASTSAEQRAFLRSLDLPPALFPRSVEGPIGTYDPAVAGYRDRATEIDLPPWRRVPWHAWVVPAAVWGVLIAGLLGAVLCIALIVHRQWADNERLAFPLAGVYAALIEAPPPGRALNPLLASRAFWLSAGAVFGLHAVNGLHAYFPGHVPPIPLQFDLAAILADEPWTALENFAKRGAVYFSIVGICYFIQSSIALSLFACYLMVQVYRMLDPSMPLELGHPAATDQSAGAVLAFAGMMLWIGRHHFAMVARQMLRGRRPDEPAGDFVPYALAGWGLLACGAVVVGWLVWAGAGMGGAVVVVVGALVLLFTVARVVAETGLVFVQVAVPVQQPLLTAAAYALPGLRASTHSTFFAALFTGFFTHDARETLSVHALHGLHVTREATPRAPRRWPVVALMVATLAIAFVVAGVSTLVAEYAFAASLAEPSVAPINAYGTENVPANQILSPAMRYANGQFAATHDRATQIGIGAGLTGLLAALRLRLAWWPLHPIGYLLAFTRPVSVLWFSLLLGWGLKVALLRYGGGGMFRRARPVFVGLIVGEVTAAAAWLVVNLLLASTGLTYHTVAILP